MARFLDNHIVSMAMLDCPRERGQSPLHSASVHISSLADSPSNPQPWLPQEEGRRGFTGAEMSDYLSPMKLVQLTAEPDLSRVTHLELTIDTSENSVGNFGAHLPNLSQLRFIDSNISCIRDLGISLSTVKILWMARCKLKDLDGLPAFQSLQEFYLAFNEVEDISMVTMLPALDVLDLESNNLTDEDQLGYLALCPSLVSLTLEGNPLSIQLSEARGGVSGYRAAIHVAVPQLKTLDDTPFSSSEAEVTASVEEEELAARSSLFMLSEAGMEKDWKIVQQSIKIGSQMEHDTENSKSPVARPMTAPPRRSLSISPTLPSTTESDESSILTHGLSQVICGNPVRALRARKQHGLSSQSAVSTISHSSAEDNTLQDSKLDPVLEHLTVTRTTSEESLLPVQQPNHLFQSTAPPQRATRTPSTASSNSSQSAPMDISTLNAISPPWTGSTQTSRLLNPPSTAPSSTTSYHVHPPKKLPTPPSSAPPSADLSRTRTRPNSVADFRAKRYRKPSSDSRSVSQRSLTSSFNGTPQ